MIDPITASNNAFAAGSTPTTAAPGATLVNKNVFLQLLVAQIKNQDPLNPTDGVQFLTQLAQFQQVEQSLSMGQDLAAVRADLDKMVQTGTGT